MFLVDTSVWIDYINDKQTEQVRQLAINNPPRLRRFFVSDQTISRGA